MKRKIVPLIGAMAMTMMVCCDSTAPVITSVPPSEFVGWTTNAPAVYVSFRGQSVNPTNGLVTVVTNRLFDHYFPGSLNHLVWTNFSAHTNGRSTSLWSENAHPPDWPTNAPILVWNTNSLLWGMKGLTALSPCWQGEGYHGQVPITALTRRHGYTRGHGMAPEGVSTNWSGKKVWFVTTANRLVAVTVARAIVSLSHGDYTILLFREDLPSSIEPVRVADLLDLRNRYPSPPGAPRPVCETEQSGQVNTGIDGFRVNAWKGGDSGSPDMLPFANELIFYGGRSTGWPDAAMQADMDALCVSEGLDPRHYQLRWLDLSRFPSYMPVFPTYQPR